MENLKELWLKKYDFNKAIFIDKLNEIIKQNKGVFVYDWTGSEYPFSTKKEVTKIHNRYITEGCFDYEEKSAKEIEGKNIPKEYITKRALSYTSFILNDKYYYLQINENPFFDDYIQKITVEKVENKKYQYISYNNHYAEKTTESLKNIYWELYNFLTVEEITELAKKAFELIKKQPASSVVTNRIRVNNYYDNRYHYENIPEKRETHYFVINESEE